MSDTFVKLIQEIQNNAGTVIGPRIDHVAGNLTEVKIFSLGTDAVDRESLWNQLTAVIAGKPYKSLDPYTIRDSRIFYGRDKVIVDCLSKLFREDRRILAIYGRAGVGKTSMIEAAIAPLVIQQGGRLVSISNYDNPAESIEKALKGLKFAEDDDPSPTDTNGAHVANPTDVADDEESELTTLVKQIQPASLILVFDQCELLFERNITEDRRKEFFTDLQTLFKEFSNPPKVIIVARDEDEVTTGLAKFQEQLPDLLKATVVMPLLNINEAREAIKGPLAKGRDRVRFESDDVVEILLTNLAALQGKDSEIYPPHLQIVCGSLYDEAFAQEPYNITLAQLTNRKFAQGILAGFLDLRLNNQLRNVKEEALELLVQLASPQQTRWVSPSSLTLKTHSPGSNGVTDVLEQLVRAKLLYKHSVNDEQRYGIRDAAIVERVRVLASKEISEQYRAQEEMKRMWEAWLSRDVLATSEQLQYISENQSSLALEPVQVLYLLRSAVERHADTRDWLKLLNTDAGSALVSYLEKDKNYQKLSEPSITTMGFAWELLSPAKPIAGSSGNGARPPHPNSLSAIAAYDPDDFSRVTAALALLSKGVDLAVGPIERAIESSKNKTTRMQRVKLRSAMVEADPAMRGENSKLRFSNKLLIFLRLLFTRAYHRDGLRILKITASGALCSGLLVGAWTGLLAKAMTGSFSAELTVRFTYAFFLGAAIAFGLALISPLLQVHKVTNWFTGSPAKAALILCTVIFGLFHWGVQLLNGTRHFALPSLFLMSMGFVFGSGIGLGVMTDFDEQGSVNVKWNWSYISAAALIFFLIPVVFTVVAKSGRNTLHLNIVTGGDAFATNLKWLGRIIDVVIVNGETTAKLVSERRVPLVYQFVSALDSIVVGLLLVFGFKLGVRLSNKL